MTIPRALLGSLAVAWVLLPGCGSPDDAAGGSKHYLTMHLPRFGHTHTRLADGRVVVAGGLQNMHGMLPPANNDIEIYNPKRGTFAVVARMKTVRMLHSATLLGDGRVVFIGGTPGRAVDIFDPRTLRVEAGGSILEGRTMHTATRLDDDRILLVGGMRAAVTYHDGAFHGEFPALRSIEIYDVRTKSSRRFGASLRIPRRGHTATRLDDGTVLIIGGCYSRRTELIDPAKGTVAFLVNMGIPREDHRTTRLPDGNLLITGGTRGRRSLDVAEIYRAKEKRFRTLRARMNRRREDHTAERLPDGRVLIIGGEDNAAGPDGRDVVLADVELFDPATKSFTKLPPLKHPRDDHCATLLADGVVLVTGGEDDNDMGRSSAELVLVPQMRSTAPAKPPTVTPPSPLE